MPLLTELNFWAFDNLFVLKPKGADQTILEINRKTADIQQTTTTQAVLQAPDTVFGIVGIIRLLAGPYLVLIKSREHVGRFADVHNVWKITKVDIIPFKQSSLTPEQSDDEKQYISLIESVFDAQSFFYSETFDLTNCLQNQSTKGISAASHSIADPLFFWNEHLSKDLILRGLNDWVIPVIRGFVEIKDASMNGKSFQFALISRQSNKRAGTRYNKRGVDEHGYVANNVETEQIIVCEGNVLSFLQMRGSIPLYWSQKANLKYKPKPVLTKRTSDETKGFKLHVDSQVKRYQRIICVNLIDQKGSEKLLGDKFANSVKESNNPAIRYVAFDFHKECKGMRYDRIGVLIDEVRDDYTTMGYFHVAANGEVVKTQPSVFRVNCIDCLDRTNVVESEFARAKLVEQMKLLGIMKPHESKFSPEVNYIYMNVWADNADAVSILYSGTGALKTDFTRTGKRSTKGLLSDGYNSACRYYLNNFRDGKRQDAVNLVLGKYVVDPQAPSPFQNHKSANLVHSMLKYALFIGVLIVVANILMLPSAPSKSQAAVVTLMWVAFTYMVLAMLLRSGTEVVNNPVLRTPKKLV